MWFSVGEKKIEKSVHIILTNFILTEFRIVDRVEEDHGTNAHLGEWGNADFLGLHVLVLPAPET